MYIYTKAAIMKRLLIVLFLVSSYSYAHPKTEADKKQFYEFIQSQIDEEKIDLKAAQKMWSAYIRCCKE